MATRILVTGATGFLGRRVCERLLDKHHEVWTTSDQAAGPPLDAARHAQLDICDDSGFGALVRDVEPAVVIHLAGLVGADTLANHMAVNVMGTETLYRALCGSASPAAIRVVQAGSAAAYGWVGKDELPIAESQPFRPVSAYGVGKAAQDLLGHCYWRARGLAVVRARIFNMIGPEQPGCLVPMTFLNQLAEVRSGRADQLEVGDLGPQRDFVDVRDVAAAVTALSRDGAAGQAYNIGSGQSHSVQEVLELAMAVSGMRPPVVRSDQRLRASDVTRVRANVDAISAATGWRPIVSLRQSIQDSWNRLSSSE